MPAKDFSRGYPRRGQWVVTTEPLELEQEGQTATLHMGRLGIVTPARDAEPRSLEAVWVDLVDEASGFVTILRLQIPLEKLIPVLTRDRIPKPRLETMAPSWTPAP